MLTLLLLICPAAAQQGTGSLRGRVSDELGGLIIGAVVILSDASGNEQTVTTNSVGTYEFKALVPGSYTLRATASGFALYENPLLEITAARRQRLNIKLSVSLTTQRVRVAATTPLSTMPENNASALVLQGAALDALPDEAASLTDALQALAGPTAGPEGRQILVDGFTGQQMPAKSSIRSVRINQNPFSAEYDRQGFGRIEVSTRPGTSRYHGQTFFNFNDESLNSRNPFAPRRAPHQARYYGGTLSGPVIARRASFFTDFERREADDNAVVNATILDPALNLTRFSETVLTPARRTAFSPRFDLRLNQMHTLVSRYSYLRTGLLNAGVGDFSLRSRAYDTLDLSHVVRLTETAVLGTKVVNETRFQYAFSRRQQVGDNSVPTIRVLDAFTGGGAQVGLSANFQHRWEVQNYTTLALGRHVLKVGARLRGVRMTDSSPQNFGGTYTFGGGLAPQLDDNNQVVHGSDGNIMRLPITSLERYRRTLLFRRLGFSPADIRELGGGATQFSIAGGNPEARVRQADLGAFAQDDWQPRPNLTLSLGLRYEAQSNISRNLNFAPRLAFAWSPDAGDKRQPQTVIRGGFGIFYERFHENFTLQVNRFNGANQQQFIVSDPGILDLFPQVPSVAALTAFAVPQTIRRVAADLRSPYSMQASISLERSLPLHMTLTATFMKTRTLHVLRSRNINAPLPGTFLINVRGSGVRPFSAVGNIFQYESSGVFNQHQLIVKVNNRLNRNLQLSATYVLNKANSDTDGANTFPADTYNLRQERGRSALDVRHSFSLDGTINTLWGVRLNPLITLSSARPFNITTGRDTNGDTLFTERPAFATDLTRPGVIVTRFGAFDPNPAPDQPLIPRNYADGAGFFQINLRLSRTFSVGHQLTARRPFSQPQSSGRPATTQEGRDGGSRTEQRYSLTVSVQVQNLLNHTNRGPLTGNLRSTSFGRANAVAGGLGFGGGQGAGNRRLEAQIRFSF